MVSGEDSVRRAVLADVKRQKHIEAGRKIARVQQHDDPPPEIAAERARLEADFRHSAPLCAGQVEGIAGIDARMARIRACNDINMRNLRQKHARIDSGKVLPARFESNTPLHDIVKIY